MSQLEVDLAQVLSSRSEEPELSGSDGVLEDELPSNNRYTRFSTTPKALADFRQTYGIPDNVFVDLVRSRDSPVVDERQIIMPLLAIIEGAFGYGGDQDC